VVEGFSRAVVVANRGGLEEVVVEAGIARYRREELPNGTALRVG
jgi:hypothetical protein